MTRRLVLMGSGETSPTMVTPHQRLLVDVPNRQGAAVVLDTSYGFEDNADEQTERILKYFSDSVGRKLRPVAFRNVDGDIENAHAELAAAEWLFAGPGSPTYALKVWQESGLTRSIRGMLDRGTVVLASAAALTAGSLTVPVYEIYKVGEAPSWRTGLNCLAYATGLQAAVIPHFDNAEGRAHDTRYCFLGERRLRALEEQMPETDFVLGVDEHTGVEFNLDGRVAKVFGRGSLTVRKQGQDTTWQQGAEIGFDELAAAAEVPLLQVDSPSVATAARPIVDSRVALMGPLVDELVRLRNDARASGRYADADAIREVLLGNGIAVEDGGASTLWRFTEE